MDFLANIYSKANKNFARIALPDSNDPRILLAAEKIVRSKLANIVLFGSKKSLEKISYDNGCDISGIEIIDIKAEDQIRHSFVMLNDGSIDAVVCGVASNKNKIIESIISVFNPKFFSAFNVLISKNTDIGEDGLLLFADSAVNINPNANDLANIAVQTADSFIKLTNREPHIAVISHSTKSDYSDETSLKSAEAVKILRQKKVSFTFDGELQADTAILPRSAKKKDPEGVLEGFSNALIFPDLTAANISLKLLNALTDAVSIGSIIQGISKKIGFVSRSCVSDDIINAVAAVGAMIDRDQNIE